MRSNDFIAALLADAVALERFDSFVATGSPDECWHWTGHRSIGYGRFKYGGKPGRSLLAARVALARALGRPPLGMACHACDVSDCVNPAHLYEGTAAHNSSDARMRGRLATGTRNQNAKLTMDKVRLIRSLYKPRVIGMEVLARRFGVTNPTIYKIVHHLAWKEQPPPPYQGGALRERERP